MKGLELDSMRSERWVIEVSWSINLAMSCSLDEGTVEEVDEGVVVAIEEVEAMASSVQRQGFSEVKNVSDKLSGLGF